MTKECSLTRTDFFSVELSRLWKGPGFLRIELSFFDERSIFSRASRSSSSRLALAIRAPIESSVLLHKLLSLESVPV